MVVPHSLPAQGLTWHVRVCRETKRIQAMSLTNVDRRSALKQLCNKVSNAYCLLVSARDALGG